MSDLCGCRGFAGSSACILKRGHEGDHSYGNYLEAVVREDRAEKESLRQQLAQCEEGCRIKDEQIETFEQQLAATADLSGVILCDAMPAYYLYKFNSAFGDGVFWSHRPTYNGDDALESIPLYRAWEPKG